VPARLDHDHRLGARGGPRRGDELAGGGNRLDIQQDGPGVRLVGEVIEHVAKIHIGHIPQRDQVREADAPRTRPIEHRGHHGPRLGDEGQLARSRMKLGEARVEPHAGNQDPQAVGSENAQHVRPRGVQEGLPQALALLVRTLPKAGRDNHRRPGPARGELLDDARYGRRGCGDDRQVRRDRQARYIRVGEHTLDGTVLGVDRHHRTVEARVEQVVRQHRTHGRRPLAGADQCDRARLEEIIQVTRRHASPPTHLL